MTAANNNNSMANELQPDLIPLLCASARKINEASEDSICRSVPSKEGGHFYVVLVEIKVAILMQVFQAGPRMDIVLPEDGKQIGFLAESVEEFAEAIIEGVKMLENERLKMAAAARKRASMFSE